MEITSKLLEAIAFNTRPKIQEHMLIIMDKSTHEEHLSQPLQTKNKQNKIAVTFLSAYKIIFNITNSNNKIYFKKGNKDEDFIKLRIPPGAYEIESLDDEIRRIIIEKGPESESDYPFRIKPNFSTVGSIVEILTPGPQNSFVFDDSIGILLGFNEILRWGKYNLSDITVDILSFDNIFIDCNIVQEMIFKEKRSGIVHNFTMDVDPGYKYTENFRDGVQWYMMESKDFFSSICFKLKKESGILVSLNGQSITFRLCIKEV